MIHVMIALLPGVAVQVWLTGWRTLIVIGAATVAALATEIACTRRTRDLSDGSAVVTGLLIGLCLPVSTPWFVCMVASVIAIALAKHAFGGLGNNVFNPAMAGYAAVLIAYPALIVEFDAISGATALEQLAHRGSTTIDEISTSAAFGVFGASNHEWINLAFLAGGLYLIAVRVIQPLMPLCVLVGIGIAAFMLDDGGSSTSHGSPLFNWFAGGTMLTAFFVATDPVTSPSNRFGIVIYALGIGAIAMLIRKYSSWPDGFAFSVLLANCFVPLLERIGRTRISTT
ncbi:MAG: RnfABCDGE type electron transport complex subunit D [Pseudomonadales bacterium]|nr:RnfABCDGE type electron transport complex subunit D [Pseudomonadales bacterium]